MLSNRVLVGSQLASRRVTARAGNLRATRPIMASATSFPSYNVVVKGDPVGHKLGDCPFCHRVLLTLEQKHIPYSMDFVDFANKPDWLMAASGGKVPVLRASDNFVMPDSDAIVEYLEKSHPDPSMKSTVDPSVGSKLFPAFKGFLTAPAGTPEETAKRGELTAELQALNDALSAVPGPLFGGEVINATDAALAPKLYHCQVALAHFKSYQIPEELTAVNRYLNSIKQLPAWKAVDYGAEAIIKGWSNHS